MNEPGVANSPKGANSPTELQYVAQKLADLTERMKTIIVQDDNEKGDTH